MEEINLDFLKTPPKNGNNDKRVGSPFVFNEFDVRFANKKRSKKFALAANIAKVDELVQEIDQLKSKNDELQQQLKGFQSTAKQVQELYIKEKNENSVAKQDLEKLQKEHVKIDENLANMSLVNEQLKARLEEYEGRPISFENLVVKYVKLMTKFQEDDMNKYSQDKDLLERLREYCLVMKYKVPRAISPKKSRSKGIKTQTTEAFVQCDLLTDSTLKIADFTVCKNKAKMQNQSTQCTSTKRDQGSQYISTMVTRQTNTEIIVQKHVQTMFPEPPAIEHILEIYSKWSNIRSVSPLMNSPPRSNVPKEIVERHCTTGTCTMLCNVRRKIDYLPTNSSSNIKQEYFTPSASPTPNADNTSTNGPRANSLRNNATGNINSNSLLGLFNSTTNSSLGQLSFNAFNELWQIFGKMLLSLIQNSNTDIANTSQSAHINQQQFLDWMLELYTNSTVHNSSSDAIRTQSLRQQAANDSISPLIFNNGSILSTSILRPQPQKALPEEVEDRASEIIKATKKISSSNLTGCNLSIGSTVPSDISLESSVSNKMQQQQITSSSNKSQVTNLQPNELTKTKILDKIQELLPDMKLNKKKRKILKRILKSGCDRKKFNEFRKPENPKAEDKPSSIVILTNDYDIEDTTETAVDFLKTFAVAEQNTPLMEQDFSETEKIFFKQVSNDKGMGDIANNAATSLAFKESSCSLVQSLTAASGQPKCSKRIENKYQLLFGDSDGEENENFELIAKPVIKSTIDLESTSSMHDKRDYCAVIEVAIDQEMDVSSNCDNENDQEVTCAEDTCNGNNICQEAVILNDNSEQNSITEISEINLNEKCNITLRNAAQNSLFIPENLNNSMQAISMPDIPISILKDLESAFLPDIAQISESELTCADNNLQNLNPSLIINNDSFANIEKSLVNDLDFASAVYCVKQNNEIAANANAISKTEAEAEVEEACLRKESKKFSETPTKQDCAVQTVERTIEENFNPLPRLAGRQCFSTSMKSQPAIISSTTIYPSDFEKDFELSSDNESLSNENYIKRDQEVTCENESSDDNSCYENSVISNTSFLSEAEQTNNLDLFREELCISKEDCNLLLAESKEINSIYQFRPQNDDILYLTPNKHQDQQKVSHISCIELSDSSEVHNISELSCKTVKQLAVKSLEAKEKTMKILASVASEDDNAPIILLPKLQKAKEHFASHKEAFNNHKDKPTTNTPILNGDLRSTENGGEKNVLKINSANEKQNNGHEQTRSKTKENSNQLLNSSCSVISSQSQFSIEETVSSLACSIITVKDSTSSDDSVKSDQNFNASNEESDKKYLPKKSGLASLKLLHLNNTASQQKSYNNIKEININKMLRTTTNRTEESLPSRTTTDKETVKRDANTEMDNEEAESSSQPKSKTAVSQQISDIDNSKVSENLHTELPVEEDILTHTKYPIQYEKLDEADRFDLSDSLSVEDELMIDEEPNESTSKLLQNNPLEISFTEENCNDSLDSSNISTLLNSSLYSEVLTESLKPIVSDLLQEDFLISKRGRKRKSVCLPEPPQPCKRSQRLKAKQIILEESLNLSKTQIEFVKYSNHHKNVLNSAQQKSPQKEDIHKKAIKTKARKESLQKTKILENEPTSQLGFFREIDDEDEKTNNSYKKINATSMVQQKSEIDKAHTHTVCDNNKNPQEILKQASRELLNQNVCAIYERQQDGQTSNSPEDCTNKQSPANFFYTDSPQSPTPIDNQQINHTFEPCVNIPLDRPIQFLPQVNNPNIFDTLINSYKNEHQKQVLDSISQKKLKQKEHILKQFKEQIIIYCNDPMELDLYCTSTKLLNKLLSIRPDYNLIQKAIIYVAQHAASSSIKENELPSIIQEMPPRHLSKRLQRLFAFLKIAVTRNSNFCQDLNNRIENLLFNIKQMENLSLQATLNLTQLFLMASKVQEYLQIPKHPARLFVAKCLYYYLQKSILMIHEVLLWYPTVLPHREDKTYDRSDALISVIQQILMNTKYDMDKAELRGKLLISKLRYEYHFEPFKPTQEEVVKVLVEKLKNSKFYNISLAFGLLCKRIGVIRTQNIVLDQHLLPLANEYYCMALKTSEYDKRIEIVLEIISVLVKAMPIETDTKKYFREFARFLNGFERQTIQEAALCSILRLQRFNLEHCYSLLCHFQPSYNLNAHTQAMLKTFLYRRPISFWKNLK